LALEAEQPLFITRLDQFVHHGGGVDVADRHAILAGDQSEPKADMALAGARVPDRNYVFTPLDVL
jgi:hypothetical protein